MVAAGFEFTDRAVPIVQMGRSANREQGDARWGSAVWGVSQWGARDWEPEWTDLTCEIHEITTDTGRAGAVDRFRPGTATVVASNVHGVSKMIWPLMPPPPTPFEFVPQPPIDHEELLQAPNATTVVSNGWSFTDDFETAPPRWIFPPAWTATGTAPYGPFKVIDEAFEPELYPLAATNWSGNAAAQWTGLYDPAGNAALTVELGNLDWPATPSAGTPNIVVDLMFRMGTTTKECDCARFTLTPNFAGANSVQLDLFHMTTAGAVTAGGSTVTYTTGTGTNGVYGDRTLSARVTSDGFLHASFSGVFTDDTWTIDTQLAGGRVGLAVHYEQGTIAGTPMGAPRIVTVEGDDFTDDFTFPTGSGWILPAAWRSAGFGPMFQHEGQLQAATRFQNTLNGEYLGYGMAQWVSEFDGDQTLEVEVSGVSMPRPTGGASAGSYLELYTHGNPRNRACMVVYVNYDPGWGATHSVINWSVWQYGPNGEIDDYAPSVAGSIDVGATDGVYPEPDRWKVESDLAGEQRIYRNGVLLGTATATAPATGGRIGVHLNWRADNLFPDTNRRPAGARIDQIWAGLQEPLGTEELGTWVRIGVDHAELGEQWFFRGFVDGIVPTYIPNHADAVRIECIDSLGEAGRAGVIDTWIPHRFAAAPTRIRQLLNAAHWPGNLRQIHDDSTLMSRPANGKAVDGLTRVAESCGGAVYGDPVSGDIVFKGTDWQGVAASLPPLAVITNVDTEGDELLPRVCPVGWELSKRRGDLLTRVRLSSETSDTVDGHPIVKEWRSPEMEHIYGVELYEATVLAITAERINELAIRQLRVRGARDTPRVEAVLLDAATADEALDLMTTATFTVPSKYRCSHHADDDLWAFNTNYLVTGVRHRIRPTQWTCRLALDLSAPFHETGGRWGRARWSVDVWGKTR